jgi:hypothetical protein
MSRFYYARDYQLVSKFANGKYHVNTHVLKVYPVVICFVQDCLNALIYHRGVTVRGFYARFRVLYRENKNLRKTNSELIRIIDDQNKMINKFIFTKK